MNFHVSKSLTGLTAQSGHEANRNIGSSDDGGATWSGDGRQYDQDNSGSGSGRGNVCLDEWIEFHVWGHWRGEMEQVNGENVCSSREKKDKKQRK